MYKRSVEDKKRNKKHLNKRAKTLVPEESQIPPRRKKEWSPVEYLTVQRARRFNVEVRKKGGMWFIPSTEYARMVEFWD